MKWQRQVTPGTVQGGPSHPVDTHFYLHSLHPAVNVFHKVPVAAAARALAHAYAQEGAPGSTSTAGCRSPRRRARCACASLEGRAGEGGERVISYCRRDVCSDGGHMPCIGGAESSHMSCLAHHHEECHGSGKRKDGRVQVEPYRMGGSDCDLDPLGGSDSMCGGGGRPGNGRGAAGERPGSAWRAAAESDPGIDPGSMWDRSGSTLLSVVTTPRHGRTPMRSPHPGVSPAASAPPLRGPPPTEAPPPQRWGALGPGGRRRRRRRCRRGRGRGAARPPAPRQWYDYYGQDG